MFIKGNDKRRVTGSVNTTGVTKYTEYETSQKYCSFVCTFESANYSSMGAQSGGNMIFVPLVSICFWFCTTIYKVKNKCFQ